MENPYEAPSSALPISNELRRPLGVAILSLFAGIISLVLLVAFVILVMNWQENNEFALQRRMAPSVFWFFSGLAVIVSLVATVGMWKGTRWGWWIACGTMALSFMQNAGSATMVNLSQGAPSTSTFTSIESLKFVVRGILVLLALFYWLRTSVRKYFLVEKTSRIKAVVLSTICGIGITTVITVVLQSIFLFGSR